MIAKLKNATIDRINQFADAHPGGVDESTQGTFVTLYALGAILAGAQTILFPAEQAAVFAELAHEYADRLDYELPFPCVLIEFMAPVPVAGRFLLGLALAEDAHDRADFRRATAGRFDDPLPDGVVLHNCIAIFSDGYERILWQVANRQMVFDGATDMAARCKNLAIACIAYINCENITLERSEIDATANRKRERKGKRPLEPFYLCRIRGVRYEPGEGGETGRHVSFMFPVRGHFRRLEGGKTIWVRTHFRGLAHGQEGVKEKVYKAE